MTEYAMCENHPDTPAAMQIGPHRFVCLDQQCVEQAIEDQIVIVERES